MAARKDANGTAFAVEAWPIERLRPYAGNPRDISEIAVAKVAASLRTFGWRQPIVAGDDGDVIAGHTRRLAALAIQAEGGAIPNWPDTGTVPVHPARGMTADQIRAYRIADNRTGEESTWDNAKLAAELQALQSTDVDLAVAGFDLDELDALLNLDGIGGDADTGDGAADGAPANGKKKAKKKAAGPALPDHYVIVVCRDEEHQRDAERALTGSGYECRRPDGTAA